MTKAHATRSTSSTRETTAARRIRVLVAKPGLDGHDVGAKILCRALMDAGMEVIYSGLRQSPAAIARIALQEAVDVVGLSILSGAHLALTDKVVAALKDVGRQDALLMVGGTIPRRDHAALKEAGVRAIFATGTPFDEIISYLEQELQQEPTS